MVGATRVTAERASAGGGQQFADLGECALESGKIFQACRIGYTTAGKLNADKRNCS